MKSNDKTRKKSVVAKALRRRRITFFVLALIILAVVCLFTPAFNITEISVKGNRIVNDDSVIRASGISVGDNVFRINVSDAQKNISSLGYVKEAKIKRRFPAGIVIEIKECSEAAYILFAGNYVGIDLKGKVISVAKSSEIKADKPVISGMALKSFETGSEFVPAKENKKKVLMDLFSAVQKHKMLSNIVKINLSDTEKIKFTMDENIEVILGDSKQLDYKITYLIEVMKKLGENTRGGTVDLSDTENVVYKGGN